MYTTIRPDVNPRLFTQLQSVRDKVYRCKYSKPPFQYRWGLQKRQQHAILNLYNDLCVN